MGRKYITSPLGLLSLAALLPKHWDLKVYDCNVKGEIPEELWQWADLVFFGGMLFQQKDTLSLLHQCKLRDKFTVIGGPDPSAQPQIYSEADVLVLNEAEITLPMWFESCSQGKSRGVFSSDKKPDMTKVPTPRFDLVDLNDYVQVGIQYSRGCPFNCEFCDVIEFYGRVPRAKTKEQIIKELDVVYQSGFRGNVAIVDDNLIGNKKDLIQSILPAIIDWQKQHKYPFAFYASVTANAAEHDKLLELLCEANIWMVFVGIEASNVSVLQQMNKKQNLQSLTTQNLRKFNDKGILVFGGFINGADFEDKNNHLEQLECINQGLVSLISPTLLAAVPKTQLLSRLNREGRLLFSLEKKYVGASEDYNMDVANNFGPVDHLNFIPDRSRVDIFYENKEVLNAAYGDLQYMNRIYQIVKRMRSFNPNFSILDTFKSLPTFLRALGILLDFSKTPKLLPYVWRNFFVSLFWGPVKFRTMLGLMVIFRHFRRFRNNQNHNISHYINVLNQLPQEHLLHEVYQRTSAPVRKVRSQPAVEAQL